MFREFVSSPFVLLHDGRLRHYIKTRGRCRGTDVQCFVCDENWPPIVPRLEMKNDIMNKGEFDPADGLTAFDGIRSDSVLSQEVEVQEMQDAALANDVQPRLAWSKNGELLAAAPNNNMHLASGWNNDIKMPAANNI